MTADRFLFIPAFLPAPLIFGRIIDSTCIVWRVNACGRRTSCWLYDMDTFWFVLHGMLLFLMIGVIVLASVVCYLARNFDTTEDHSHFVSGSRRSSTATVSETVNPNPTGGALNKGFDPKENVARQEMGSGTYRRFNDIDTAAMPVGAYFSSSFAPSEGMFPGKESSSPTPGNGEVRLRNGVV